MWCGVFVRGEPFADIHYNRVARTTFARYRTRLHGHQHVSTKKPSGQHLSSASSDSCFCTKHGAICRLCVPVSCLTFLTRYVARQRWIWAYGRVCQLVRRRKRKQFEIMSQRATDRWVYSGGIGGGIPSSRTNPVLRKIDSGERTVQDASSYDAVCGGTLLHCA